MYIAKGGGPTDAVCFEDVLLLPQYSEIESRTTIDIGNELGGMYFTLPIISAPMDTVTEDDMADTMTTHGGLGIIHRYNEIDNQAFFVNTVSPQPVGAAIGVTGNYIERAHKVIDSGAKIICIDVAHAHHVLVRKAMEQVKKYFPDVHLMVGNIATPRAFRDLEEWGADSIKIGIGGGSICSTRIQTGHGVPTLQSVLDCKNNNPNSSVKIIADGGIKNSGDIVKALAAGADFVMLGSLLAGTTEAPGNKLWTADGTVKEYRGMASKEAQMEWKGTYSSNEGISTTIPYKGTVENILKDLRGGITSGFSYSGASNIKALHESARFIKQSAASRTESHTHILEKR